MAFLVIPAALYLVLVFLFAVSPFSRYPPYVIKCGGRPIVATDFAASYTYWRPGSEGYGVDLLTTDFFCTEAEAQRAGFQRADLPGVGG